MVEERKGLWVDVLEKVFNGFFRLMGFWKEDLSVEEDKKGLFYVVKIECKGCVIIEVFFEFVLVCIYDFKWFKLMWWGVCLFCWV